MLVVKSQPVTFEYAKSILDKAYEADRSSSYQGNFVVRGSHIYAKINKEPNPTELASYQRFTVSVESSTFSMPTLEEIVE